MKTTDLKNRNNYLMNDNGQMVNVEVTYTCMCGNSYRFFYIENGIEVGFQCDASFVEKCICEMPTPSVGQYVYDIYYNVKKQVKGISGELFFIGSDREPVRRHEFTFPLPR